MLKRLGKIIFLILFLLIILNIYLLQPETSTAKEIIYGDVNQDGVVNNYDIIILNKHILGEIELSKDELIASDVNLDNLINKYDVELINISLLNKISLPNTTYTDFEIDLEKTENEYVEEEKEELVVTDEKYLKEHETKNGEKYTIIGSLKIEKIGVEYDILSATSAELLKISVNKYWGANPNEVGNMCILGHNWFDSRFFGRLHTLQEGDAIEITDSYNRSEKYYVYDMYVIEPDDTDCTSQLTNGKKEITLITCYNNGTQRLVVKARAEEVKMEN